MSTGHLRNIKLKTFKKFLIDQGCRCIRTKGGHEIWSSAKGNRPIVLQSHEDPIPEFILKNNLRNIGLTRVDFINWLKS